MPQHVGKDDFWAYYKAAAFGLLDYAKLQAIGGPISDHALFPRYRIEGVTLIGRGTGSVGLHHIS